MSKFELTSRVVIRPITPVKEGPLKRVALGVLGARVERTYMNIYDAVTRTLGGLSFDELTFQCALIPNRSLRETVAERGEKITRDKNIPEDKKRETLLKFLIQRIHERSMITVGERCLQKGVEAPKTDILYDKLYRKAKHLIKPKVGFGIAEITARQLDALAALGNGDGLIYETDHSRDMQQRMQDAGHGEVSSIPWLLSEQIAVFSEGTKKELATFTAAYALASVFVRDIYTNPDQLADSMRLSGNERKQFMEFSDMIRKTLDWKMPDYLPTAHTMPSLEVPFVFSRPDFARERKADGSIRFVATEMENSPGGLGMLEIVYPGYNERSNVTDHFAGFMRSVTLPDGSPIDRNRLTILMTEDWNQYRPEMQVFLKKLEKEHGIAAEIVSIEELAKLSDGEQNDKVRSGFIFHFAYPWNFIKDASSYYVQLMRDPTRAAELLGVPTDDIISDLAKTSVSEQLSLIDAETKLRFMQTLEIPEGFIERRLLATVYRPGVLDLRSQRQQFKDMTLREIGERMAIQMKNAAENVYARQSSDLCIFNDPSMGSFLNTKVGLSLFHLPSFDTYFSNFVSSLGYDFYQSLDFANSLQDTIAETIPAAGPTGNEILDNHVQAKIQEALAYKDGWVIKLSVDPKFGMFDWGSRSLIAGTDVKTQEEWTELIQKACGSNLPWVLQRRVDNVPYSDARTGREAREIPADGTEAVGIFVKVTKFDEFKIGELRASVAYPRYNPFLFGDGNASNMKGEVAKGLITLKVIENPVGKKVVKVHGSTDSAMAPLV